MFFPVDEQTLWESVKVDVFRLPGGRKVYNMSVPVSSVSPSCFTHFERFPPPNKEMCFPYSHRGTNNKKILTLCDVIYWLYWQGSIHQINCQDFTYQPNFQRTFSFVPNVFYNYYVVFTFVFVISTTERLRSY